ADRGSRGRTAGGGFPEASAAVGGGVSGWQVLRAVSATARRPQISPARLLHRRACCGRGPEPPHPRRDALPHVLPGPRDRRSVAAAARPVLLGAPMTQADLPPYDPERILGAPFPEKIRLVCTQWASQVNP